MPAKTLLFLGAFVIALTWQSNARADPVDDCMVMMAKEQPSDSNAELRAGCTCQLGYIKAHVAPPDYVFWTQQLAIMGSKTMADADRNRLLLQLLRQRGVGAMMQRIADAAQAALPPCRLERWGRNP